MECPRGWILTINDQGFMVPFFIKTRSCDVFYSSSISNKFDEAGVIGDDVDKDRITVIPPGQTYLYRSEPWDIQLNNDESFRIGTTVTLSQTNLVMGADNKCMEINLEFPFPILTEHLIDIHVTKECNSTSIITSHINVKFGEVSEKGDVSTCTLQIYKFDGQAFDAGADDDPDIIDGNNKIHISIFGIAQLGEYSHMDDASQIGAEWDGSSSGIGAKDVYTKSQTDALVAALRADVEAGKVLTPPQIIDVADEPEESVVLPSGIIIDIDENSTLSSNNVEAPEYISEDQELSDKMKDDSVVMMDINDIRI